MFETEELSTEKIEQSRTEGKSSRTANRKKKITRHCCLECGEPKHYVCLEHHNFQKTGLQRIYAKARSGVRTVYFTLARKLNFVR